MFADFPYVAAFLGGLLSFLSPCVLPLVPGYLSFIAGIKMEEAHSRSFAIRSKVLSSAVLFVAGFSFVFIALGAGASGLAPFFMAYQSILTKIAGIFIVLMGLHLMGIMKLKFLYREWRVNPDIDEVRSFVTPFILGLAFGLGWTPCIGPVLAGVLVLASAQETVQEGMALLSLYAMGMGIPFLIAAVTLSSFNQKSKFLKRHLGTIEKISGAFLILTGLFIFTGDLQQFGTSLIEIFPFLGKFG